MRRTYLVCYDITDDRRRNRVFKVLRGVGEHLQFSVFECQLNETALARCRHELAKIIHNRDDQVLFVDLGPVDGRGDRVITALGRAYAPIDSPCFIADGTRERRAQFQRAEDELFCLSVARVLVGSKIRNQRTLLQRNHVEPPVATLARLKRLAVHAEGAPSLEALLGIEGTAAREYFEQFTGMLKVEADDGAAAFSLEHRNRRPPRDPVNALLSLGYALLAEELTIVCAAIGFDPFMGFLHQPRFGRPALALDLMEPFRPLIVDSAVLSVINTGMLSPKDFVRVGPSVALNTSGRKAFLRAYEQRMDGLVTHPRFGYRVSYRRVLEIQARLLARVVEGELSRYEGFETR